MPITRRNIDLPSVVQGWFRLLGQFETITAALQYDVGFRTVHSARGDIVLYATQLESIAHSAGYKHRKYAYPIEAHSSIELREALMRSLCASSMTDLGDAIGDLRNEIAHIGRPRRYLEKLPGAEIGRVAYCLSLSVLGYVLDSIGIPTETRNAYQRHLLPVAYTT
jgi:hypothetical protein